MGNKGGATTTTSSTNTTRADPQADALYRQILERAGTAADTPYQAYNGELVAPVNAQQNLGIGNINANAGFAQPYIQNAAGYANQSAGPVTASDIQNYQDPYTQQVVDATQAQFDRNNAKQQTQLKGNAIASNALGGNRVGVAQSNLAGEQVAQQAPVIGGLYDKGWQTALGAAQADKGRQGTAAYSLGNLGVSGQNAALTGAQSQIGAGTIQQSTQLAEDQARYGQFMQAQGYPYQQLQWLAGLGTGVGSQLGGTATSTGQTTTPAPDPWQQVLGLGVAAAGAYAKSDARLKEHIQEVGRLHNGQKIYRYRFKGEPHFQIGLIAQEELHHNPDAVRDSPTGLEVDYKAATDDAARSMGGFVMPRFATGGGVGAMPWADAQGWIPQSNIVAGHGAPSSAGQAPAPYKEPGIDPDKIAKQAMGLADLWKDRGAPKNILPEVAGFAPSQNGSMMEPGLGGGLGMLGGLYAAGGFVDGEMEQNGSPYQIRTNGGQHQVINVRTGQIHYSGTASGASNAQATLNSRRAHGGRVAGFAFGGLPDDPDDVMNGDPAWSEGIRPPLSFADRAGPTEQAIEGGDFDPQGANATAFARRAGDDPAPVMAGDVPMPEPRPAGAGLGQPAPAAVADGEGDGELPDEAKPTSMQPGGMSGFRDPYAQTTTAPEDDGSSRSPLGMSNAVSSALIATGLGLMSSRSRNFGNALGDAGMAGLGAYGGVKAAEALKAKTAEDLSRDAAKYANELKLKSDQQTETGRHNRATEAKETKGSTPSGYRFKADGSLEFIPGGPADTDAIQRKAEARKKGMMSGAEPMDDATVDLLAHRVRGGDRTALVGLGRGAQGAENLQRIQQRVAQQADQGLPVSDAARSILANVAQNEGYKAGSRTQAQRIANLQVFGRTAFRATDLALEASRAVPRTQFIPANRALEAFRTKTGNPEVVAFGAAVNTLVNEYAKAVTGGNPTVESREHAREMLNTAQSPEQFEAVVDMMRQELTSEEHALPEAKRGLDTIYNPPSSAQKTSVSEGVRVPTKNFPSKSGSGHEGGGDPAAQAKKLGLPSGTRLNGGIWTLPDGKRMNYDGSPVGP